MIGDLENDTAPSDAAIPAASDYDIIHELRIVMGEDADAAVYVHFRKKWYCRDFAANEEIGDVRKYVEGGSAAPFLAWLIKAPLP